MTAALLTFLSTLSGQATLAAVALWALGMLGKSAWYLKAREAVGRAAEAAGVAVSTLGVSRLKSLWNPIEQVICDFLFFAVEQFAVGLRKDNLEKMEQQLDRLESVGSETRADALAIKLDMLETIPPAPAGLADAELLAAAVASGEASVAEKLNR